MSVCSLDLSHPFFVASMGKLADDHDLQEALQEIKTKVEEEHTSCGRVVQKFYGVAKFSHLHDKIWKYDWGKSSARGRKSWRMVVVVPEPSAKPYKLIAGAIYCKSGTDQLPAKELAAIFSKVSHSPTSDNDTKTGEFHRVPNGDGKTRSLCLMCYEAVGISELEADLDQQEQSHRCDLATDSSDPD